MGVYSVCDTFVVKITFVNSKGGNVLTELQIYTVSKRLVTEPNCHIRDSYH